MKISTKVEIEYTYESPELAKISAKDANLAQKAKTTFLLILAKFIFIKTKVSLIYT